VDVTDNNNGVQAYYDRGADILPVVAREGRSKYVVGRRTFVIFADGDGIWRVDLEAESRDSDVDVVFTTIKVEVLQPVQNATTS
jgi:hypothetical protein